MEWTSYLNTMMSKEYDLAGSWIGDYMDPLTFGYVIKDGGNNRTNWSSDEFEELLVKQKEQQDRKNDIKSLKG